MGVEKGEVGGLRGGAGGKEKMKVSEEVRGGRTESLRYLFHYSTYADQLLGFCSHHVWDDR